MSELMEKSSEPKTEMSWSKRIEKNGITKSISVRSVENGFIITIEKYGRDNTVKDSEYTSECKTYVSFTNPLEKEVEKSEENNGDTGLKEKILSALEGLGEINV